MIYSEGGPTALKVCQSPFFSFSRYAFLRPAGSKPASWSGRCLTFCDADAHHGEVVVGLGAVAVGLYLGGHGFYHLPG